MDKANKWTSVYTSEIESTLALQMLLGSGKRKAVAVALHCTSDSCDDIMKKIGDIETGDMDEGDCITYIRWKNEEHEDLAGQTQKAIIGALMECPKGVILYDGLQGMI